MIKEIGKLHFTVGANGHGSYLKEKYFTPPFKVANVSENPKDSAIYLMTMSSSPGILDNDDLDVNITVERGGRTQLRNQGYQRLFNMKKGAVQHTKVTLHENSELSYIQHPLVPQESSIFKSYNSFHLADNCILTYSEVITCGRKLCGEVFRFKRFQNLTELYHGKQLLIKDNVLLEPEVIDINAMGQVEGFTHQGTLFYVTTRDEDTAVEAEIVENELKDEEDLIYGFSRPYPNVIIVRVLGNGGEQLLEAFRRIDGELWRKNSAIDNLKNESRIGK